MNKHERAVMKRYLKREEIKKYLQEHPQSNEYPRDREYVMVYFALSSKVRTPKMTYGYDASLEIGQAKIGIRQFASECGMTREQLIRRLDQLRDDGFITLQPSKEGTTVTLTFPFTEEDDEPTTMPTTPAPAKSTVSSNQDTTHTTTDTIDNTTPNTTTSPVKSTVSAPGNNLQHTTYPIKDTTYHTTDHTTYTTPITPVESTVSAPGNNLQHTTYHTTDHPLYNNHHNQSNEKEYTLSQSSSSSSKRRNDDDDGEMQKLISEFGEERVKAKHRELQEKIRTGNITVNTNYFAYLRTAILNAINAEKRSMSSDPGRYEQRNAQPQQIRQEPTASQPDGTTAGNALAFETMTGYTPAQIDIMLEAPETYPIALNEIRQSIESDLAKNPNNSAYRDWISKISAALNSANNA